MERVRRAAIAGVIGPVGFLSVAFAAAALRSDVIATNGWASWPSSMATAGPAGFPQGAAFLFLAACYAFFAIGALRPAMPGPSGIAAWGGFLAIALGDVMLAFPADVGAVARSWHGTVHVVGVAVVTAATAAAAIGVAYATRRAKHWRPWRLAGAPVVLTADLIGVVAGSDQGWAKVAFVVGITAPVPLIAILLRRE